LYINFCSLQQSSEQRSHCSEIVSIFSIWKSVYFFAVTGDNGRKFKTARDIPGPFALPILGTRWIYSRFGHYSLNKIHEAYQGKEFRLCPFFFTKATLDGELDISFVRPRFLCWWHLKVARKEREGEKEKERRKQKSGGRVNTVHYMLMCPTRFSG